MSIQTSFNINSTRELSLDAAIAVVENVNDSITEPTNWSKYNSNCARYVIENQDSCFFATAPEALGYVLIDIKGDRTYIPYIAVKSSTQKNGIGSALLTKAVEKTRDLSIDTLCFDCRETVKYFYSSFADKSHITYDVKQGGRYSNGDVKFKFTYHVDS